MTDKRWWTPDLEDLSKGFAGVRRRASDFAAARQADEGRRVCKAHCGHEERWLVNSECYYPVATELPLGKSNDYMPPTLRCGHRCTFPSPLPAVDGDIAAKIETINRLRLEVCEFKQPCCCFNLLRPFPYHPYQIDNWAWKCRPDGQFEYSSGRTRIMTTGRME